MDKLRFQNPEFPVFQKGRLVLHVLKAFPFYQIKIFQFPVMLPQQQDKIHTPLSRKTFRFQDAAAAFHRQCFIISGSHRTSSVAECPPLPLDRCLHIFPIHTSGHVHWIYDLIDKTGGLPEPVYCSRRHISAFSTSAPVSDPDGSFTAVIRDPSMDPIRKL